MVPSVPGVLCGHHKHYPEQNMKQPITDFHTDEEGHWVADLACGHQQHVRHTPPWQNRPWVMTVEGRAKMLGQVLDCKFCVAAAPQSFK
jgi:hypothetical protein